MRAAPFPAVLIAILLVQAAAPAAELAGLAANADKGLRPEGEAVAARVAFRKNRGVYGSDPTDVLLRLKDPRDAKRVREWTSVVRLVGKPEYLIFQKSLRELTS